MRNAINDNPMVQLAVVAVLVLVAGVMLAPHSWATRRATRTRAPAARSSTTPSGSVDLTVKSTPSTRRCGRRPPLRRAPQTAVTRRRWYLAGVCRAR